MDIVNTTFAQKAIEKKIIDEELWKQSFIQQGYEKMCLSQKVISIDLKR